MNTREREYYYLNAELAELDNLLSMTPESAVIDRISLEYRKSQVEQELKDNPPPKRWPASALLSFNGKPVVDKRGIYADFAGVAVDAFTKAVTSLAASQRYVLGERGVIPQQDKYRLLVTGTTHGSFGFEIEETFDSQTSFLADQSAVEAAIGQAQSILKSLVGDEEALADAIADTDERALDDIRSFLKVMADNDAVCSLSFKNAHFGFRDIGQVQTGLANLGSDNLQEGETTLLGHFQGFLPKVHRAELVISQSGEVLSCLVDRSLQNADSINDILGQGVRVSAHSRQVGNSRPRYTIMNYELLTFNE